MNVVRDRDYSAWPDTHFQWNSIDGYSGENIWRDGVHTISLDSGPSLDLVISGSPLHGDNKVIPIFLSGAVQSRELKAGPFFSGSNVSATGGFPYISISDPSLELDPTLGLAWYAGNEKQDLTQSLLKLLRHLIAASGKELLLIGGSGGGFAALKLGQKLGNTASVFVWNAQTDILEYNEKFVRNYLKVAYPALTANLLESAAWKETVRREFEAAGVELSLLPDARAGRSPRRVLFVQNATDWHVPIHTAPFIEACNLKHLGRGVYWTNPDQLLWVTHFGTDHQPLPADAVTLIIKEMLDPMRAVIDIVASLQQSKLLPQQQPGKEPRDLRQIESLIALNLSLELEHRKNGQLYVRVNLGDVPASYGGITFGFFTLDNAGVATNVRWFSSDKDCLIEVDTESTGAVQVRVRDGFNNELTTLSKKISPTTALEPLPLRVFIYGSCVSRDAFQFPHDMHLVDYVARSPLGSAFAEIPSALDFSTASISSSFQRRMVEIDLKKELASILRHSEYDLLLLDLIDERIPLMNYEHSVVAYSSELQSTGVTAEENSLIGVGTDAYFARWLDGLSKLLAICPASKIVVNKVWWATTDSAGALLPNQGYINTNNAILERLYAELGQYPEIRFIEYPANLLVADAGHKWGAAPYHFVTKASTHLLTVLAEHCPPDGVQSTTSDKARHS
ncbi:DUF6270 domain-containing protein [Arthrobacter sp. R4]|uniref:DUF6270 domain-containing protein n=1 Tax=Arthrobacter sp. R4 TaxID=644417 RepID=UPI003EDA3290